MSELSDRLRERHLEGYSNSWDAGMRSNPICLGCRGKWPCPPIEAADALNAQDGIIEMERADNAKLRQRLANKDKPAAMCCMCFDHFNVDGLSVTADGEPVDVCKLCAAQEAAAVLARYHTQKSALREIAEYGGGDGGNWVDCCDIAKKALKG